MAHANYFYYCRHDEVMILMRSNATIETLYAFLANYRYNTLFIDACFTYPLPEASLLSGKSLQLYSDIS